MATAYAAVTSLMHLIAQLHEHPDPPIKLDQEQVDSLKLKIRFFQSFLEAHHATIGLGLELRIADSAQAVEDLIETHIADRIPEIHDESLQKLIEGGFDRVIKEAAEIKWNPQRQAQASSYQATDDHPIPPSSSQSPGENIVVGIDDIARKITEKLTSQHNSGRHIISISGMGGIGKTTLARKVYDSPYIEHHFHKRAWASVPKDYRTKDILVQLLCCLGRSNNTPRDLGDCGLSQELHQSLFGKKYLVILDNVWDRAVWESLMSFFPTESPGGAVVITTRDLTFGSISSHDFPMKLLDEDKSWELFTKKVFGGRDRCPRELQEVGKNIAIKCRGLPLSIVVIGGHLAKSPRTQKVWKDIENKLSFVVNSLDDGYCTKILSTSYINLPVHLKPCFLYMAILPEDEEIQVSKLIRLWSAEGFLKPIQGKSIEEAAEHYINDLADRSLIIPTKSSSVRKNIKRCTIHDLLRNFCITEASEKKFIYIAKKLDDLSAIENERRIVRCCHMESQEGHSLPYYNASRSRALRTLIFEGELSSLKDKKLLRVLAPVTGSSSFLFEMLDNTNQLVNVRYLDPSVPFLQDIYSPSPSIYLLWNLQYLYFNIRIDREAPLEIWKMPLLKDVKIRELSLSDPPSESNDIMKNLQSAGTIINFNFSKEAVERIPNIKKLKLRYDDRLTLPDEILSSIDHLGNLESLGCILDLGRVKPYDDVLRYLYFPHSLRELEFSHLRWGDVTTKIGSLPLLEVLKLSHCEGSEWDLDEQKFSALKLLQLTHCRSLRYFEGDNHCFPRLRRLVLEHLDHLEEIYIDVGDIATLESIQVRFCPDSAVTSAQKIAERQHFTGNDLLQVKVWLLKESGLSEILSSTKNFFVHHAG